MCRELGRWLRVAGYDAAFVDRGAADDSIYRSALDEARLLITRDHYFKTLDPQEQNTIFLLSDNLDSNAEQLRNYGLDWLYNPFSRCLQCNYPFRKIHPQNSSIPKALEEIKECWQCPKCLQFFWRGSHTEHMENQLRKWQHEILSIGFGGDLMIGRLVDKHLNFAHPSYPWGNLLSILEKNDLNIVNLETTLTRSKKTVAKVFNFKASPERVSVLKAGNIHVVNLANNHILDFSEEGLRETLETLDKANIKHAGAGRNLTQAQTPCFIEKKGIKIGILGCTDNEPSWAAAPFQAGVNYFQVGDLIPLADSIVALKQKVDFLILSIHWGPNMRKKPPKNFQDFAHQLIDLGVDILHGHSAHVFQGIEVYKGKLIFYDTGDLIDDYAVDPWLRNDCSFFFNVTLRRNKIGSLRMIPTLISNYQVNFTDNKEQLAEMKTLCKEFNTYLKEENNELVLYLSPEQQP